MSFDNSAARLAVLRSLVDRWVVLPNHSGSPEDEFDLKLNALQRIVELARLTTGVVVNKDTMRQVLNMGISIDTATATAVVGNGTSATPTPRLDTSGWSAPNERMPNELQAPLLLYLLRRYKRPERIHDTIENFVRTICPFLTPFDTESTVTGVPRIMTNTRVAASLLRDWGLIQNSSRVRYKSWELTHLGLLTAAALSREGRPPISSRTQTVPYGQYVAEPIRAVLWQLQRIDLLVPTLYAICSENADFLGSLDEIHELVTEYGEVLRRSVDTNDFVSCRQAAIAVLRRIEGTIPVASLADDMAVDSAIRDVLGT